MNIGVVFPQTEFGNDPVAIRDYAQTAEDLGFTHILAYDHVLGANPNRPGGWQGPYTHKTPFHEPFILFSYLAGLTSHLKFVTGIIILPQRQVALVAKQAATLDVLSGGRLRLGVGLGWNKVEYEALGEDFHNRGQRIEEQVDLLRRLWMEPLVTYSGKWNTIPDAGINPLPIQRPIPIWFGGQADSALRRMARLADGWLINSRTPEDAQPALDRLKTYLDEAGRNWEGFGLEPRLHHGDGNLDALTRTLQKWQDLGANYISVNTMNAGLASAADHISAIRNFAERVGLAE
jgi:probable F420-dependent oxidoreductase